MCGNVVNNYAHALGSVPDSYKTQNMCNKAVSAYPSSMKFVPDQFKTHKIDSVSV